MGREPLHARDEPGGEPVGLAAGGAVADRDQPDAVRGDQPAQRVQRTLPVLPRLVRVDGRGVEHLAGGVDDRDLDAGADARIQPHHRARAGRRGQQQVAQVVGEDLDRHRLGRFAQAGAEVALPAQAQLDPPGPGDGLADQLVARPAPMAPAEVARDAALGQRDRRPRCPRSRQGCRGRRRRGQLRRQRIGRHQLRVQPRLRAAAQHRERSVARDAVDRLRIVEVAAELGSVRVAAVLARRQRAAQHALDPQPLAQRADQRRVLGPALGEQVAHAVERRLRVGKAGIGADEGGGFGQRVQHRVGEEPVGQRLQPRLARDLALGAAPRLVRQVQVFQLLLGRRGLDGSLELGAELALLGDALQHRGAAVFQLAQVGQSRFERAQLGVVEAVGGLLAVAGDEGHGGAAVEQLDGGAHLRGSRAEFGGDLLRDLVQGEGVGGKKWGRSVPRPLRPSPSQPQRAPRHRARARSGLRAYLVFFDAGVEPPCTPSRPPVPSPPLTSCAL